MLGLKELTVCYRLATLGSSQDLGQQLAMGLAHLHGLILLSLA